jgi:hypothetical protein
MTDADIQAFIEKWARSGGAERANYVSFLNELCDVIGVPHHDPTVPDDDDNAYVFERRTNRRGPVACSQKRIIPDTKTWEQVNPLTAGSDSGCYELQRKAIAAYNPRQYPQQSHLHSGSLRLFSARLRWPSKTVGKHQQPRHRARPRRPQRNHQNRHRSNSESWKASFRLTDVALR